MNVLKISSPAFPSEGWIPNRSSGFGEDFSPELHIEGLDAHTVSLAVTLDDLEHPIQPGFNHWVAWNIPPVAVLPEHLPKGAVVEQPFSMKLGLAYGKHCYRGPKPPFNWDHRYCFTIYALDSTLEISTDSDKSVVMKAMEGHILQTGTLYGLYQRRHKD